MNDTLWEVKESPMYPGTWDAVNKKDGIVVPFIDKKAAERFLEDPDPYKYVSGPLYLYGHG